MKYLFSIQDLLEDETKLYSVEAEDEVKAGNILAKQFMPKVPRICFGTFVRALEEIDLIVVSLGSMDSIEEVHE